MNLTIDNQVICARSGQTLLELIRNAQMDTDSLVSRPLAAKIAGAVFTLN